MQDVPFEDRRSLFNELERIDCPYARAIHIIGNRSILLILKELYLSTRPYRFNELLRILKPMSSKTLSEKLKHLEQYDLVKRSIVSDRPVSIEYSLTEKGLDLKDMLDDLSEWSRRWFPAK